MWIQGGICVSVVETMQGYPLDRPVAAREPYEDLASPMTERREGQASVSQPPVEVDRCNENTEISGRESENRSYGAFMKTKQFEALSLSVVGTSQPPYGFSLLTGGP
jgi:hypothetical protein